MGCNGAHKRANTSTVTIWIKANGAFWNVGGQSHMNNNHKW